MSRRKKPQRRSGGAVRTVAATRPQTAGEGSQPVAAVIHALKASTGKDIGAYKPATIQRRVEYRMGLHGLGDAAAYLAFLRQSKTEAEALLKDLLIHVTGFFRDSEAFAALAQKIADKLRHRDESQEFRAWIPGCSTGEEAYSLGIVLLEQAAALGRRCEAHIFATDIDEAALATARAGIYPESIKADLGPERLERFFLPEKGGFKVGPDLTRLVTFGRHDILSQPPFFRLDLVSCRNMLIYLAPDAQRRVLDAFDFALEKDGLLMLGTAESPGAAPDLFEACDEEAHLYRKRDAVEAPPVDAVTPALQEIVERMMLQTYGPASVVVNRQFEPVYYFGEVDPYLKIIPGQPNQDLLSMAREGLRANVRDAVLRTLRTRRPVSVHSIGVKRGLASALVTVDAQCVGDGPGDLVLVSFIDELGAGAPSAAAEAAETAALRRHLDDSARQLALAVEERDALREEVRSLGEELQTLNGQMRDLMARRSEAESADPSRFGVQQLQMLIEMVPDAALAIDRKGCIRYANGQAERLFGYAAADLIGQPFEVLVPSEQRESHPQIGPPFIGRTDRTSLAAIDCLSGVARDGSRVPVHIAFSPVESGGEKLVLAVIHDMWKVVQIQEALQASRRAANQANLAKSRFIAAANHDLRQPLQAISLLHGVLEQQIVNPQARETLAKLDDALAHMTDMTNSLVDLDTIESGGAVIDRSEIALAPLLAQLADEFEPIAAAKGLKLRCVPASVIITGDLRLLTRILRTLLSKAIKYTDRGRILLGCRRRGEELRIEVWDSGDGLAAANLEAIFDEFHRIGRSDGGKYALGLDLYLVQRWAELQGFGLDVYARDDKGSMFALIVSGARRDTEASGTAEGRPRQFPSVPVVLLVDNDPTQRRALESLLAFNGYHAIATSGPLEAMNWLHEHASIRPSAMIFDDGLSGRLSGLELVRRVRRETHADIPALLLCSEGVGGVVDAPDADKVQLMVKPVKAAKLITALELIVRASRPDWQGGELTWHHAGLSSAEPEIMPDIAVIDDDPLVCLAMRTMIETEGHKVRAFSSAEAFLADPLRQRFLCLIVDIELGGMDGLELQNRLKAEKRCPPIIFLSGSADVKFAIDAIRNGAADFMIKPVRAANLRDSLARVLSERSLTAQPPSVRAGVLARLATLTNREREIMEKLLTGELNKNIAADLGISERTTEHHRQSLMRKMGVKSLAMLVRMIAAVEGG